MKKKLNDQNKMIQYFHTSFKKIDATESKASPRESISGVIVKGYASTPTLDRYNDVVEPEAFRESIVTTYKKNPITLFQHNADRPIGKVIFMTIDHNGLYVESNIIDKEIEEKISHDILKTFSIGYIPKEVEYRDGEGNILDPENSLKDWTTLSTDPNAKRIIKKVDLVEISIVSIPANPDALFSMERSVKSFFDSKLLTLKNMQKKPVNLLEEEKKEGVADDMPAPISNEPEKETETPEETKPEATEAIINGDTDKTPDAEVTIETVTEDYEATEDEAAESTPEEKPEDVPAEEDTENVPPSEAIETDGGEKFVSADIATKAVLELNDKLVATEKMIKELEAKNQALEKKIASTPAKSALIAHEKFAPANTEPQEKSGFKSALIESAR